MVKGISRRVLVVHPQERGNFEEAIFFLRDEALGEGGVTEAALLQEARQLAANGVRPARARWTILWLLLGAAIASLLWGLGILFF